MATYRARGEIVGYTETIKLQAQFRALDGSPKDTTLFPLISIVQPSGNVILAPTRIGVTKLGVGLYGFDYFVALNSNLGVYADIWQGELDGNIVTGSFNFIVNNSQIPSVNSDGYEALGDDPGFHYSQTEIRNINKLMKTLRARLNSSGKKKTKDQYGNDIYKDCDIFSVDTLTTALANSITHFNQIPYFTGFTFSDTWFIDHFHHVLVQGALIMILSGQALIERGREYTLSDNSVQFNPPTVSEILGSQWGTEFANHTENLKYIKNSMRPAALGLGTMTMNSAGVNPAVARLRHLRERKIF